MFSLIRMTMLVGGAAYDGDFAFTGASEFNPDTEQPYVAPSEFYRNEAAGDGLFHFKTADQNNVGGIRGDSNANVLDTYKPRDGLAGWYGAQ